MLLVDDEAIVCDGLTRFVNWEELGYQVVSAANSVAQALVYMEFHPVDIVISDIKMPVQSGLQLLEVIQEEYPDVNTIILSGYGEFEFAQKALRLGAVDFLMKPVNFGELKKLLTAIHHKLEVERNEIRYRQDYKKMQINNLLNNLAKGYISDLTHESVQHLQLSITDDDYYVARIQLNRSYMQYDTLTTIKEEIHQVAGQAAEGIGTVYVFNNELNEMACLFTPLASLQGIQRFADELLAVLVGRQIYALIGISARHQKMVYLKEAYIEAGKALQYSIINNKQKMNMYSDMDHLLLIDHSIDEELVMDMLNMLANPTQRDNLVTVIHSTIDAMDHSSGQSVGEIHSFCIQTMFMLSQHIQSFSSVKSDFDGKLYSSIRSLLLTPNIPSIKDNMASYLVQLNNEMTRLEDGAGSGSVIANVKRYINEHFAEDISLNTLSNVFFIHPIYLSRLFKEKTGVNFIDYVTEVRISNAKELLKNHALKIYDICQMVGYDSPRYFSKLFKNTTGMTPKEFKKMTL